MIEATMSDIEIKLSESCDAAAVRIGTARALGKADYALFWKDKNIVAIYDIEITQLEPILLAMDEVRDCVTKDLFDTGQI